MPTAATFERQLTVATAGLAPEQISARLAIVAKQALAEAIAAGEASPRYTRLVNGVRDAAEETVKVPGAIVYRFFYLEEAARLALGYCIGRSPVSSGAYRDSWFILVNGTQWDQTTPIPITAQIVITNDRPYARKIEVGSMQMSLPPRIVEGAQAFIRQQYRGVLQASVRYVSLSHPYILRHGRKRGQELSYPALVLQAA